MGGKAIVCLRHTMSQGHKAGFHVIAFVGYMLKHAAQLVQSAKHLLDSDRREKGFLIVSRVIAE